MNARFVYDDSVALPPELVAITGVSRFGSFILHGATASDLALRAASSLGEARLVGTVEEREAIAAHARDARVVWMTSDILESRPGALADTLDQLAASPHEVMVRIAGGGPETMLAVLHAERLRRVVESGDRRGLAAAWERDVQVLEAPALGSMYDAETFMSLVGGAAHARSFNRIEFAHGVVTKRSNDEHKARAEHDFWYQLPPELQRFVVRPTDFRLSASGFGGASYRMERYHLPDAAILWIHGSLSAAELSRFFDSIFAWVETVPHRDEDRSHGVYVEKVRHRIHTLLASPAGEALDARVAAGTPHAGLSEVLTRYERLALRDRGPRRAAIQHGDLCLSNILYDKRTGDIHLIDPRGASSPDETWMDALYDLAKLSQCILGGYDFITRGLFDVHADGAGLLTLRIHESAALADAKEAFQRRVRALGHDPLRVRLYEASLFLSMLPLHQESGGKLMAFVLNALDILDEVAQADAQGRCPWLGPVDAPLDRTSNP